MPRVRGGYFAWPHAAHAQPLRLASAHDCVRDCICSFSAAGAYGYCRDEMPSPSRFEFQRHVSGNAASPPFQLLASRLLPMSFQPACLIISAVFCRVMVPTRFCAICLQR